jgi:hypothetical protein
MGEERMRIRRDASCGPSLAECGLTGHCGTATDVHPRWFKAPRRGPQGQRANTPRRPGACGLSMSVSRWCGNRPSGPATNGRISPLGVTEFRVSQLRTEAP